MTPPADTEVVLRHRRSNGCSCPWHPLQLVAWFCVALFTVSHYSFTVYYVPGLWRVILFVLPGLVLIVHVLSTVVATAIDPAEPGVRKRYSSKRPAFNRSTHKHVIENQRCHICEAMVSATAKHCRICDKCILDFDHHCKWLNTCIGARNYRWFITTLVSALAGAVLLFCFNLALFILFFADRESLRYGCDRPTNVSSCDATLRVFSVAVPDPVFPTITAVMSVLGGVAILLIGHLTAFHLYLMYRGVSTYDYIIDQRAREQEESANPPARCSCCGRQRANRVLPASNAMLSSEGEDARSVTSCTSMSGFGRTPPPSFHGSQLSVYDNRTDEQKLHRKPSGGSMTELTAFTRESTCSAAVAAAEMAPATSVRTAPPVDHSFNGRSSPALSDTEDHNSAASSTAEEEFPSAHEIQMDIINKAVMARSDSSTCSVLTTSSEGDIQSNRSGWEELKTHALSRSTKASNEQPAASLTPDDIEIPAQSPAPRNLVACAVLSTSNASSNNSNCLLEVLPLSSAAGTTATAGDDVRPLSPIVKKVSFEDSELQSPRLGKPNARPLPPIIIGGAPFKRTKHRPLPPIAPEDGLSSVGSRESLQSSSSSFVPGSTNSLPLPDPRYRRSSSLRTSSSSLESVEATGGGKRRLPALSARGHTPPLIEETRRAD